MHPIQFRVKRNLRLNALHPGGRSCKPQLRQRKALLQERKRCGCRHISHRQLIAHQEIARRRCPLYGLEQFDRFDGGLQQARLQGGPAHTERPDCARAHQRKQDAIVEVQVLIDARPLERIAGIQRAAVRRAILADQIRADRSAFPQPVAGIDKCRNSVLRVDLFLVVVERDAYYVIESRS